MGVIAALVEPQAGFVVGKWSIFDDGQEFDDIKTKSTIHNLEKSSDTAIQETIEQVSFFD